MKPFEGWQYGIPPPDWKRLVSMDVGGASANHLTWLALDDKGYLVAYAEINHVTTNMRALAQMALPHMKHPSGQEYEWKARVVDYENRVAADDMGRWGIRFDNAIKHDKMASIQRLTGYLHPNPKRPFPEWHPKAGTFGSPLLFILPECKVCIKELPLQKWKLDTGGSMKDEMDRAIRHDGVDTLLYAVRILPAPIDVAITKVAFQEDTRSLQTKLYWEDVRRHEAEKRRAPTEPRKRYNPNHTNGARPW